MQTKKKKEIIKILFRIVNKSKFKHMWEIKSKLNMDNNYIYIHVSAYIYLGTDVGSQDRTVKRDCISNF